MGFAATPRRHKLWLVVPLVVYPLAILGYLYPHLVKGNDDMRGAVLVYGEQHTHTCAAGGRGRAPMPPVPMVPPCAAAFHAA